MNQTDRGDRSKQLLSKMDPVAHQFQGSATAALAGGDTRRRNMAAKSCGNLDATEVVKECEGATVATGECGQGVKRVTPFTWGHIVFDGNSPTDAFFTCGSCDV